MFTVTSDDGIVYICCSYPGCCVLQYPPITCKCKESADTCATFMDCLHSRLPTLCGYPINYTTRLLQPDIGLSTALHSQSLVNLSSVGKKPAGVGTACKVKDCSSIVLNADSAIKANHPYKPIFNSSSMNKSVSCERRPLVIHSAANHCSNDYSTKCAGSGQIMEQSNTNNSKIGSTITTSVSNKTTTSSSCLLKVATLIMLSVSSCYIIATGR